VRVLSCGAGTADGNPLQHSTEPSGGSGAGDVPSESCEAVRQHGFDVLNSAVEGAPNSTDDECLLYDVGARCVYLCGVEIAVTDATTVQRAMDQVNTSICTDPCVPNPLPSCNGGRTPQTARCVSGECTAIAQ
jgi:hypothetical protein